MCYQLVELYSVCRCLHYQHAVDRCAAYGQPGHGVQQRTILVGLACGAHASSVRYSSSSYPYSGTGYDSGDSSRTSYHYR